MGFGLFPNTNSQNIPARNTPVSELRKFLTKQKYTHANGSRKLRRTSRGDASAIFSRYVRKWRLVTRSVDNGRGPNVTQATSDRDAAASGHLCRNAAICNEEERGFVSVRHRDVADDRKDQEFLLFR